MSTDYVMKDYYGMYDSIDANPGLETSSQHYVTSAGATDTKRSFVRRMYDVDDVPQEPMKEGRGTVQQTKGASQYAVRCALDHIQYSVRNALKERRDGTKRRHVIGHDLYVLKCKD